MTTQTHVVSTDALGTLGTVIDATAGRDAIHLAVEPIMAGEQLYPGQHIRIVDGKAVSGGVTIGIVDPFLKGPLYAGQYFWFVVYPRTITSLRHVWEHPAFVGLVVSNDNVPVAASMSDSEAWMHKWANKHMSEDYYGDEGGNISEDKAYAFAIEAGEDHYVGPYEDARDHIDSEWWSHWEKITGKTGYREEYFSCSC